MNRRPHKSLSLWLLCIPIAAWMLHFLAAYAVAALHCAARTELLDSFAAVRWWILAITAAALLFIVASAQRGFAGYRRRLEQPCSENTFLGSLLLMICALSALGTLAVAAVTLVFGDCRQ